MDFDAVRQIARELGQVEETASALKVGGKLLACVPRNKSAESGSLAVRMDPGRREDLLRDAPDVYYVTDHYLNYPMVLVRLSRIHEDALRDLLRSAKAFVSGKGSKRRR